MAKYRTLVLALALVLTLTAPSLAQFDLTIQLTYGGTNYSSLLEGGIKAQVSEWSGMALGTYTYNDLLFTALYQNANRINMQVVGANEANQSQHGRSLVNVGAHYRFLEEKPMTIYGGLGYELLWLNLKHQGIRDNRPLSLFGHGFSGQAVVKFELTEKFTADATLTAAPWLKWEYTEQSHPEKPIGGSAYNYQLGLAYDLSEEYAVRLGVFGGSYGVDKFKFRTTDSVTIDLEATKAGYSGVSVGVTWHF